MLLEYSLVGGESVLMTKNLPAAVSVGAQGSDCSDAASGLGPARASEAFWWWLVAMLQAVPKEGSCVCGRCVYKYI